MWQRKADCGMWLVHAPHGNPFWPWYMVAVVNLRDHKGQTGSPFIQFPGASHELLVVALNPEDPLPDVDAWTQPRYLVPVDQCVQFIVADDKQATSLLDVVVKGILSGISPDQDYRALWREMVAQTAEHIRLGGHPDMPPT